MKVDEFEEGGVVVLKPVGRLDNVAAPALERRLMARVSGPASILVDLSEVDYISSAGLRILLLASKRLRQTAGRLCLCSAQEHVLDVFEISGLARAFRIHAGRDSALRELTSAA